MSNNIGTILTAAVGTAAVEVTGAVNMPTPEEIQSVGQLALQAIIAIITIYKLVKKPKKQNDKV
jgi:hypothetical protein